MVLTTSASSSALLFSSAAGSASSFCFLASGSSGTSSIGASRFSPEVGATFSVDVDSPSVSAEVVSTSFSLVSVVVAESSDTVASTVVYSKYFDSMNG
jgi:hypothetical protein